VVHATAEDTGIEAVAAQIGAWDAAAQNGQVFWGFSAGTPWWAFICTEPWPVQMAIVMPGISPVTCMTTDCMNAKPNSATARNAAA
jgi:hypothetical protein